MINSDEVLTSAINEETLSGTLIGGDLSGGVIEENELNKATISSDGELSGDTNVITLTIETNDNNLAGDLGVITKEIDPTVPEHVKEITSTDIDNWNNKAETEDIPTKVSSFTNDAGYLEEEDYLTNLEIESLLK